MTKKKDEKAIVVSPGPAVRPEVKRKFTKRAFILGAGSIMLIIGLVGFIIYMGNLNMVVGMFSILLGIGGAVLVYIYWNKKDDVLVRESVGKQITKQVNCMDIYQDRVVFEDYTPDDGEAPDGFPMTCRNDRKKYWVNLSLDKWNIKQTGLKIFSLPDFQYYDPALFATRVIELPAHRRVMKRRGKMPEVVKTILLVVGIVAVWILILTTTD